MAVLRCCAALALTLTPPAKGLYASTRCPAETAALILIKILAGCGCAYQRQHTRDGPGPKGPQSHCCARAIGEGPTAHTPRAQIVLTSARPYTNMRRYAYRRAGRTRTQAHLQTHPPAAGCDMPGM